MQGSAQRRFLSAEFTFVIAPQDDDSLLECRRRKPGELYGDERGYTKAREAYIGSRDEGTRRASYRAERVKIHALMGRKDEALTALRQAIDDGFHPGSKPFLYDPTVDSICDDPRFIAMVKEISDDVDHMRRALAASGK